MVFCTNCNSVMRISIPDSGNVIFNCVCAKTKKGDPKDSRIFGAVLNAGESVELNQEYLRSRDPIAKKVLKPCEKCGIQYQSEIRITSAEVVLYKCECGHIIE